MACSSADECARIRESLSASDCQKSDQAIFHVLDAGRQHFGLPLTSPKRVVIMRAYSALFEDAERVSIECAATHRTDPDFNLRINVVGAYPPLRAWLGAYLNTASGDPLLSDSFFLEKGKKYFDDLRSAYGSLIDASR